MKYTAAERKTMAENGEAMSDGSFPIKTVKDIHDAIDDYGRGGATAAIKAHIIKRAKAISGGTDALPTDWEGSTQKTKTADGVQMVDAFVIDASNVVKTSDGYLAAFAKVARTGIQVYKGRELGRPDLDDVRVYRPESEVFHEDAMRSFAHRPITLKHPAKPVTSKNWKSVAGGQTGDKVVRDGEFISVPMTMMDQGMIDAYEKGGVKELSMGYSTDLKWEKGLTVDGAPYDAVQTNIRANHLAVVPVARGGRDLRIGDAATTKDCPECGDAMPKSAKVCPECGYKMTTDAGSSGRNERMKSMKTFTVDGVPVEVEDKDAAIIQRQFTKDADVIKQLQENISKLTTDAATAANTAKTALDAATKLLETKDGEIVVLKKAVADGAITPEKLDVLVKDRVAVIDRAKPLLAKDYVFDGKTVEAIRKDAVTAKLGDSAKTLTTDAAIEGAFLALSPASAGGAAGGTKTLADGLHRAHQVQSTTLDARDAAHGEMTKNISEAWRTPKAAA